MKRIINFILQLLIMGLIFISCNNEQVPIAISDETPAQLMKSSESGAVIVRYDLEYYFVFLDQDAELIILFGVDITQACQGNYQPDVFNFKDIYLPNEDPNASRIISQIKEDDIMAFVYPWDGEFNLNLDYWCPYFTSQELLYSGMVKFGYKDNDVLAWAQDNKNNNAYGFRANGNVMDEDGKLYKLNFVNRVVWDGVDFDNMKEVMKIQVTPIGKK